jgi:hypothetical protein
VRKLNRVAEDIGDHYCDRITELTVDTLDTCRRMNIPYKDAKAMVAAIMAVQFAETCNVFRLSRAQFLELADIAADGRVTEPRKVVRKRRPVI